MQNVGFFSIDVFIMLESDHVNCMDVCVVRIPSTVDVKLRRRSGVHQSAGATPLLDPDP